MSIKNKEKLKLQGAVMRAVRLFMNERPGLLTLRAHEQAISHRIAVHLEAILKKIPKTRKLIVDCEYNKHLERSKTISVNRIAPKWLKSCGCPACKKILECGGVDDDKLFRPDIVAHVRTTDKYNRIVIEIKTGKVCFFDIEKLRAMTATKQRGEKYHYDLGVFVFFPDGRPVCVWFPEKPN